MPEIKRKKWTEHPSIVFEGYTDMKPRLDVFCNFVIDKKLKKYEDVKKEKKLGDEKSYSSDFKSDMRPSKKRKVSILEYLHHLWENPPWKEGRTEPVEQTMDKIKEEINEPMPKADAEVLRKKIIEFAEITRDNGQYKLADSLTAQANLMAQEIILAESGIGKYMDEMDMIQLFKTADFGLRLDWLASYTEFIPEKIVQKKKIVDDLKIFDNWVVLHYDPNGKRLQEIEIKEREEQKKRDPILFGVVKGANRLYYVADWTTPKDDITMDKVLKILGRDKLAETVKSDLTTEAIEAGLLDDIVMEAGLESES